MSGASGFAAGLAYLTHWLNDAKEATAFDAQLSAWIRASGWRSAGVIWPVEQKPTIATHVRPDGGTESTNAPAELPEILITLRNGGPTVVWQVPNSSGRLYSLIQPVGRQLGVIWVERNGTEPWTETDRNYLSLAVRLIERSSALMAKIGPIVDSQRLQQRLNDAAVIAGRMAHDFDNVLTGIIGFADLTLPLVQAQTQPAKFIAEISKVGQRGIVFTQQLHQLSRAGHAKPQPSSVSTVLLKEETRLRPNMPNGLQIVTDIPQSLTTVGMDSGPLGVVLGHLIENAADASPPNGRVMVSAQAVELSPTDVKAYLGHVGTGTYIEITIRDYGTGIKPEVQSKLFAEPFYTTKVRHRGLGLAVVFRTIYAHGGGIRIEPATQPDQGTLVRVVIPPGAVRPPVATVPRTVNTVTTAIYPGE